MTEHKNNNKWRWERQDSELSSEKKLYENFLMINNYVNTDILKI